MGFLGMRGTGDFVANQRPESWREVVLRLYPNGKAPLTALTALMRSEATTDPRYHWWNKLFPSQEGTPTGVFTDAALTVPYTGAPAAAAGDTLYVKMSLADVENFRTGLTVMLACSTDGTFELFAKVTGVTSAGVNSYLTILLLEDDDNSLTSHANDATSVIVAGSANAEGAGSPDALAFDPTEYWNYTQIFRDSLEMTRTAEKTKLRTGDMVKEAKREALEMHSVQMEKAFIFGIRSQRIGSNGKPERTTGGLKSFLSTNVADFRNNTLGAGGAAGVWSTVGVEWMNLTLEQLFRYGNTEKLALCGSGALYAINALAMSGATFELTAMKEAYGINVLKWVTPFGVLTMKTHPLFTHHPVYRHSMLVVEPDDLTYRYITDTTYKPDIQENDIDGQKSEFLTEAGLEIGFEQKHGWYSGVGMPV